MTALAGAWAWPDAAAGAICRRLLAAQAPFGRLPPAQWEGDDIALGRRLFPLSALDRTSSAPERLDDLVLVADVRLDDRHALEAELGAGAARLCDQALLAVGWRTWGEGVLDRVCGPFAFAVWEGASGRLRLIRDGFGLRPLYYMRRGDGVAFASTLMGLLAVREAPLALDEVKFADLLALEPERGSRTCFEGIARVEPGSIVTIEASGTTTRRWFALRPRRLEVRDAGAAREAILERLDTAIHSSLQGAGPVVAAHLSSGWDSAAVVITAARRLQADSGRLVALTAAPRAGFDGQAPEGFHTDESALAALAAAREPNIEHRIVRPPPQSPLEALDPISRLTGRPMPNPCNQAWIGETCAAAAQSGAHVLLTGQFGNETLSWSGARWLADLAAQGRWAQWVARALQAMATGGLRPGGVIACTAQAPEEDPLWRLYQRITGRWLGRPGLVSPLRDTDWRRVHRRPLLRTREERTIEAATLVDLGPLDKAHLAAFGVDMRHPLMDRRLVETCLGAPPEMVFEGGRPRRFARRLLRGVVPDEILAQTSRGLQAADWYERLDAGNLEVREEIERLARAPPAARLLDLPRLARLAAEPPTEGWGSARAALEYRQALWRGVAAGRFMRLALGLNV